MIKKKRLLITAAAITIVSSMGIVSFADTADSTMKIDSKSIKWESLTEEEKQNKIDADLDRINEMLAEGRIDQEEYEVMIENAENGDVPINNKRNKGHMAIDGDFEGIQEKLDALTEEEKSQLSDLQEQKQEIEDQIIDEYYNLGVISEEVRDSMKEKALKGTEKFNR